jgi:1-acyl-sn-glycerol-3-phosphate acyltransferase
MRTALVVLFYLLVVVLGLPFILFCMLTGLREPLMGFGLWAARVSRRVLGIEVEVSGLEWIVGGTPCVFMPNHASFLDGPLMMMLIPGRVRVILKQSILRVPIVGPAMRFVGFVPVDRKGARSGKKSIERAAALMRERGYSFLIFPEGTRTLDGRFGPFRRGGFFLAIETGAPIVPVTISGTRELMPKGRPCARRGRVGVVFHRPIPVAGHSTETMGRLMDEVRTAILAGPGAAASGDRRHDGQTGPGAGTDGPAKLVTGGVE